MKPFNLLKNLPDAIKNEIVEKLLVGKSYRVERIVSQGQVSDKNFWYCQKEDEFVLLLQGEGHLEFAKKGVTKLKQDDYLFIPAFTKHRIIYTSKTEKTVWIVIFFER